MLKTITTIFLLISLLSGCSQPKVKKQENIKLKTFIDNIINKYNTKLHSKEIIVSIMDSKTGKILYMNNPHSATVFTFEPGSILKPISISLGLKYNKIKDNELFFAYNEGKQDKNGNYPRGKYKVGRWTIGDDHKFNKHYITLDDIFIFSSNIGTTIIANRLSGKEFYSGLKSFGLSKKTGIDLSYEQTGFIYTLDQYSANDQSNDNKINIFKTTNSYGQGLNVTFIQMLKAYNVFNNNGVIVTPYIKTKSNQKAHRVLSTNIAKHIKQLLIKTVQKGTGTKAYIDSLEIGGKTGTANMVENGKYINKYISSFFGFANDINHKYTIGVTVVDPIHTGKHWYYYYAKYSAAPIFKEIVEVLKNKDYLKIN